MTYLSKNSINEKHNNKYSNILTTIPGKKFFFFDQINAKKNNMQNF